MLGNFLLKLFRVEATLDRQVISKVGAWFGIVCNAFLFVVKLFVGLFAHSIGIVSDGFNNLSDCFSSIVTLVGDALSAKPADKHHPFGHGRYEYIASLVVTMVIFIAGWQLLMSSIGKLFQNEIVVLSKLSIALLVLSILMKAMMALVNRDLGNQANHLGLIAASKDSMNDAVITTLTLLALLSQNLLSGVPVDGIIGIVISCLIFYSGYETLRMIVDRLLGKPADKELTEAIYNIIASYPESEGVHDMMIHDYGPGNLIGSAHVEVDADKSFLDAHDAIDRMEREIEEKLHVMMTLHMDPIEINDPDTIYYRERIQTILYEIHPSLSFHDFRIVKGNTHTNLIFDIVIPFQSSLTKEEIQEKIDAALEKENTQIYTVITYEHNYVEGGEKE